MTILGICLAANAVGATPKAPAKKKGPVAPAKDPATPATPPAPVTDPTAAGAGSGSGSGGEAVQPIDDPPPSDMEGKDENPDAPKGTDTDKAKVVIVPKADARTSGYPIEQTLRPITLPANMSEISITPHAQVSSFESAAVLRARYGIVREFQIGLTYMLGGYFHEPTGTQGGGEDEGALKFKPGKAVGLDLTYLVQDWIGVKVGVPVYIDPVAVSIAVGIPLKFQLLDGKLALGGLDDLFAVKVKRFAPSFDQEAINARAAFSFNNSLNNTQSRGYLNFAAYGIYQQDAHLAIRAQLGVRVEDFQTNKGGSGVGGETVYIRGGIDYAVRRWFDLGASIGWDDLSVAGSFAPLVYAAVRI